MCEKGRQSSSFSSISDYFARSFWFQILAINFNLLLARYSSIVSLASLAKSTKYHWWPHLVHMPPMFDNDIVTTQDAVDLICWRRPPFDHKRGLVLLYGDVTGINWWHWEQDKDREEDRRGSHSVLLRYWQWNQLTSQPQEASGFRIPLADFIYGQLKFLD